METTAIIMGITGAVLLYGGLICCIMIARNHARKIKTPEESHFWD